MFKNLTLFRLPASAIPDGPSLDAALEDLRLRPPGPQELATFGFISPFGRGHEQPSHRIGPHSLLSLGSDARLLPSQVVNQALTERLDTLEGQRGRRPGGKERSRIKDEVIAELLPRAFIKSTRTDAWLDHGNGWLVVDSASAKAAETVVYHLRQALGSFPATPVAAQASARMQLTAWLAGDGLPDDFELGDECELRDPAEDGAIARCRRQDLGAEEIAEHLNAGKQVTQLGLAWDGRMGFLLDEQLTVRKLRFDDVVTEQLGDLAGEDAAAELDARFALMTAELERLLARLDGLFQLAA